MVLLGGFAFHVKQCGRKQMQIETVCPYCDKLFPQFELASHVGCCAQNPNRTRTNAREHRKANRKAINGRGRGGGGLGGKAAPVGGGPPSGAYAVDGMSVKELKQYIADAGLEYSDCLEKADLVARAREAGVGTGARSSANRAAPAQHAALASPPPNEFPSGGAAANGLVPCGHCGRSFAADRIGKHMEICAKTKSKRRRAFDSAGQRARGQEIFTRVTPPRPGKGGAKAGEAGNRHARVDWGLPSEAKLRSKWRQEHREFQNVLRNIKGKAPLRSEYAYPGGGGGAGNYPGGGGGGSGGGEPPEQDSTSGPSHFVPCPHCGRTFAPQAASRHIPSCERSHARPKPPPAMRRSLVTTGGGQRAGWNSGGGGGGGGRAKPRSATRRQRQGGESGRPLTGGPMMGGRSARFPSNGSGGYSAQQQQRMAQTAAAAAFANAGASAMYGLHGGGGGGGGGAGMRPSSSGMGGRERPPSGGGFRPNATTGSFSVGSSSAAHGGGGGGGGGGGVANAYAMGQGPMRIDPTGGGGGGFVPMLSSSAPRGGRQQSAATRWPSVYQQ